jgi:hypothetical protein
VSGDLGFTNNLAATVHVIREIIGSNSATNPSKNMHAIIGLRPYY